MTDFDFAAKDITRDVADSTTVSVGDVTTVRTTVTERMVDTFAQLTGDHNDFHTDEEAAEASAFGGRIAHGALINAFISTALAEYPGDVIYMGQETRFNAPVYLGDDITARCEVVEQTDENVFRIETTVESNGEDVVTGTATVSIQ